MPQHEIEIYLRKLKGMQTEYADAALRQPKDKTEFGYGMASGQYQGLLLAEQLLTSVIEEVANDESK
jgi:hypothetical protein